MRVLNKGIIPGIFSMAVVALATMTPAALASGKLADAARSDDMEQSRQLISAGADVNLPEPDGTTPLLWAVYNTSPELVDLLLEAGADPNIANKLGITPLVQAARYGNTGMAMALIDHGARVEASAYVTESPLMAAARSGSKGLIEALLDAGADPNESEPVDDQTALMWAVAAGHFDVAAMLLEAGADPNRRARVSELTERNRADFPSGGFVALHWAARNGDEAMIELLIENGADLNIRNGDEATPMMLAIVNDRFDIAGQLLARGADPNDGSLYYITEMRDATTDWRARDGTVFRADHPNELTALDLTRLLLEAGADPNKAFKMQMHNTSMCCDTKVDATPFYRAAKAADIAGMELMLAHGADPDWKPASDTRPIGIDGDEEEIASRSSLMVAINGGKGVGVAGGPGDLRQGPPDFREEGRRDPLDAVKMLLAAGADVHVRGPDEVTALHVAVNALHPDIVRELVAYGADLDAQNKDGKTPLQVAEEMEAPKPRTGGDYFEPPLAQPIEIAVLLRELAGETPL